MSSAQDVHRLSALERELRRVKVTAPVDVRSAGLVEACDSPDLLAFDLWPRQREVLEAVEAGPRLHVVAFGRRSGKSAMAALICLWDCLLRPELDARVRPGERRYAVTVATRLAQARLVVDAARSIVEASPLLRPLLEGSTEDELRFVNGTCLTAFPCSSRGGRGWPISTLVLDEAAHLLDTDGSSAAERVFTGLVPSTAQFGAAARVIVSSTPWGSSGLFADLYSRASSGELDDARPHHGTTAEVNPTIEAAFLQLEERRDPETFKSEYLAQFVGSGGAYFDPEAITGAVTLGGELSRDAATDWVAGLDPAFSSDPFGLTMVGVDKTDRRRLVVGLVRSWLPQTRKPASLEEGRDIEDAVLDEVAATIRLYGARAITDQYRAAGVVERLRGHGVRVRAETMTAPAKDAAFGYLRGHLNEGSIELYQHPDLLRELRAVRTRHQAGRSSVVLPRIGRSHCDLAQSLALAVLEHDRFGTVRARATVSRPRGRMPKVGSILGPVR